MAESVSVVFFELISGGKFVGRHAGTLGWAAHEGLTLCVGHVNVNKIVGLHLSEQDSFIWIALLALARQHSPQSNAATV